MDHKLTKLRICNKCGWAHFPQSYEEIKKNAETFVSYWAKMSKEDKEKYYGSREYDVETMIAQSSKCFRCGNDFSNFHNETERDHIPMGVTIQGVRYDGE